MLKGISTLLQLVGVATTALGMHAAWREFPQTERFWHPVLLPIARAGRGIVSFARLVTGKRTRRVVVGTASATLPGLLGRAYGRVGFGELPPMSDGAAFRSA